MADDDPGRASLRGDPGASPGAHSGGRVGDDRRQPGQERRRQPAAAAHRKASFRVVGAARRGRHRASARAGLVVFAAATGLRPGEWIALERRDIDRDARVVYVRRAFRNGRIKCPKTEGSIRAVPLQTIALEALDQLPAGSGTDASLSVRSRCLLRPPQLPHPRVEARSGRRRDHTDPPHLRPPPHLRYLRATSRRLDLRSLPLHGRQPDNDRPPLRPPRTRRTRARDQPPRQPQAPPRSTVSTAWTLRGHFTARPSPPQPTHNGS